jgi:type II secretory pathway component PulM
MFETRLLVALLWIALCVLARSERERKILMVGTVVLLVLLWVSS